MPITALPTPPSRNDPANFAARGDAFLGALPTFQSEANALAVEVDNDRIASAASASTATTQATNSANSATASAASALSAASASNASAWISGTTYQAGNVVYSTVNYVSYRRKITGAGTTDPSADSTNWVALGFPLQTGNDGKFLKTDGTSPVWEFVNITPFSNSTALAQLQATSLCF
jgi:hypothetical protein